MRGRALHVSFNVKSLPFPSLMKRPCHAIEVDPYRVPYRLLYRTIGLYMGTSTAASSSAKCGVLWSGGWVHTDDSVDPVLLQGYSDRSQVNCPVESDLNLHFHRRPASREFDEPGRRMRTTIPDR